MASACKKYTFRQGRVLVGASEACDLCLAGEPLVSQEHLRIFFREGDWYLEDLGSTGGTTLNGEKLMPHGPTPLHENDCIVLAEAVKILFRLTGDADHLPAFGRGYWGIVLLTGKSSVDLAAELERRTLLSREEELELAKRFAQGDRDARNKLIEANYYLVEDIARRYTGQGADLQDLIQEGSIALLQAMEKFDCSREHPFSVYAHRYISNAVRAFAADYAAYASEADDPLLPEQNFDVFLSYRSMEPAFSTDFQEAVEEMLGMLTAQEADVLRMRYGLPDGHTHSPEEVGRVLGVSPTRVRQIEHKAIRKLRHTSRVKYASGGEYPDSSGHRGWFDDTGHSRDRGRNRSWMSRNRREAALPRTDDIQFRAAAPTGLMPGRYFLVKLMAYLESDFARADREQQTLGHRVAADSSGIFEAAPQQTFQIRLFSQDFAMEEKLLELTWNGKYASAQTDILLPADYTGDQVRLVARVSSGIRVLTDLILILQVQAAKPQEAAVEKRPIKTAFASYASLDRDKVLARIQGLLLGREDLDVFLDKKDMVPGEYWEQRLYKEIDARDIFYLFWSSNARNSTWVQKELAYAIEKKGSWFIQPVALEDPRTCPPPEQLRDRHFGDWTLHYMSR